MPPVTFSVAGIGGFGRSHLGSIQQLQSEGLAELKSVVVRSPKKYAEQLEQLTSDGVTVYASLEELIASRSVDVIALPTGIQYHEPQTIQCLDAGYHVFCEPQNSPGRTLSSERDRKPST